MKDQIIIKVENLRKIYKGSITPALDDISFEIPRNKIFGLLGPNGAGKTTTINILCGLYKFNYGKVTINGYDIVKDKVRIKPIIGVVPQDIALYDSLTANENLRFVGKMYGLSGDLLRSRIEGSLLLLGLEKNQHRKVKSFSGGMKRRLNLIAGILHKPGILFLDEPTVGIDVQSKNVILEHLRQLNRSGTTIIYTSHYMEEAENLCDHITIIDFGKVIAEGEPQQLITSNPELNNLESIFLQLTGRNLRDH